MIGGADKTTSLAPKSRGRDVVQSKSASTYHAPPTNMYYKQCFSVPRPNQVKI